ncbi:MAG: zinc carboxypeptidase, partial [Calditrichaeota bacterium]
MKQIGIVCLLLLVVFGQAIAENYQKIRIYLSTSEDIQKIADLGIDFEGSYYKRDQFIDLQISRFEKDILENSGFITEVLISDLEEFYRSRLETRTGEGFGYGSMGGYYTYSEVMADLDSLIATYPNLVSQKQIIGYSVLGKPLVAVRISDNPNIQENEPEVLYTGLHHAREPMSMMVLQYFMWYLVENYGSDPQATFLVDNRQMWFIPVVNPDGYVYNEQTNPNGGGMWRLNARDNNDNGSHFQSGIDGVDLNRNYGYQWGYDNSGSSPTPGSQTYRGPGPFSEVETAFVRDFCNQHQYITALNYHTYSNLLIHPWAYNDSPTPDHQYFYTFGMDMTRFNGYVLGTPSQTVGYAVNGDANDWMYGEQTSKPKIFAYTPEVGSSSDNFWPPTNRILPLAQENLYPNIVLSYIAGSFPKIVRNSIRPYGQNRYADPGEMIKIYPEITNYGLKPTGPVGIELVSRQPSITVLQNSIQFPGMQTFDSLAAGIPWKFQVPYTTVPGTSLVFDLQIFDNGTLVNTDSLIMTVGTFDIAFADSGNTALTRWSAGGSNGSWGMTSTSSHSPVYSFTDSPVGDYANSCDFWLRSESVNLSDATSARLHYWTKWDIEAGWDFGLVEISTNNGISWTSVKGNYMKPASGSGVQTPGLFGYDGVQNEWVQESID